MKIGGNHAFFRDNYKVTILLKSSKIQSNVWVFFFFKISEALLSLKNAGYPQFSFWIPEALAKFCFP